MKTKIHRLFITLAFSAFSMAGFQPRVASAVGTAFVYEGQLTKNNQPASGLYDFTFALFNNGIGASGQVGSTLTNLGVEVADGQFAVTLDFGNVFNGTNYWLAISVSGPPAFPGPPEFTTVRPLQPILSAPYALYAYQAGSAASASISDSAASASTAGSANYSINSGSAVFAATAGSVSASNIVGSISAAQLPPGVITNGALSLNLPPKLPATTIGSVNLDIQGNFQAQAVAVAGSYAYVVTYAASLLEVVDISIPSAPAVVGSVKTQGGSRSVAVAGRYAYVVNYDSSANLQIFDISNPSAPTLVGSGPAGYERSVAVSGKYAYLTGDGAALQIFDVSNPSAPVLVGTSSSSAGGGGTAVAGIAVAGHYAYVTTGQSALQIFDVSNPSAPVTLGSAGGGGGLGLALAGRYAYVANNNGETLLVIDIASPSAPTIVGSYSTGYLGVGSIAVAGHYVYKTTYQGQTLQVIDVSNPSSPSPVGSVPTSGISYSVAVSGREAIVAVDNTLQIFDLGGASIQQLEAGAIDAGTLQVIDTVNVGHDLNVNGGLAVGAGMNVAGDSAFAGNNTFTGYNVFTGDVYVGDIAQSSDRNVKQDFATVDPAEVLGKVTALPITEWSFKTRTGVRHLGPMAQDFYAAFKVGPDEKHITTVDEGGVALAAIQGLNQKINEENAALRAENANLKARLDKLEKLVEQKK